MRTLKVALTLSLAIAVMPRLGNAGENMAAQNVEHVGRNASGRLLLPTGQQLTPVGIQVDLPKLRPQGLALSPDGKILVTSGKSNDLIVVDPATGQILQTVALPPEGMEPPDPGAPSSHNLKPTKDDQISYTGLIFSPDGKRIYLSNVTGSIKVFSVDADHKVTPFCSIDLPAANAPRRKSDIPTGLALSKDGKKLYVALNMSNRLLELDLETRKPLRLFDVGVAPYDVAVVGHKVYVSNWGGRRPDAGSLTGPAGRGMTVRVDPVRHIASEGSVSVVDLDHGTVTMEILTGLHACALAVSPDQRYLCVANSGGDSITVIDIASDRIDETIALRWHPNDFYGASPNALVFDAKGKFLYVCNGTQNAIAVVAFRKSPTCLGIPMGCFGSPRSELKGLIPVGWYPGAIALDALKNRLYVANIKGTLPGHDFKPGESVKYNSHEYRGSLSLLPIPSRSELSRDTKIVFRNYRRAVAELALLPPRSDARPRPVPERAGEPSVFKHVVYIIKENRTYDQVLGDIKEANGDEKLCIFGERITPNEHKMVREFAILDNTYCAGICSADGHEWSTTAFATDYMEKSFAGFPRSYPDGMEEDDIDALAYAPSGFIWDNALAHGVSVWDYGEFAMDASNWKDPKGRKAPQFLDYYHDFVNKAGETQIRSVPAVASLNGHLNTNTTGWSLTVPDVVRAAKFREDMERFEKAGSMPQLIIICLPNDHTSGTSHGAPTPAAQVADNDLAFGQIVETLSHSSFWKETCIFAIEDDPQSGWDHVSGYRTTAYCISPYTKRRAVVSEAYNNPGMIRTMELILGLPPMNQMDASATPMQACFTDTPDFTPYVSVTNNVPLDEMNPAPQALKNARLRSYAIASARLPLSKPDQCPEDLLNRILWCAQKGPNEPYPEWALTTVIDDDD
jgi:DNA-binding beta-propeller fold protein YncE